MSLVTDKNDPGLNNPKENSQNKNYLVLSEEERTKGFVRPVRKSYEHRGKDIDISKMLPLDATQFKSYGNKYIGFIPDSDPDSFIAGRYIKKEDLKKGCGTVTTMNNGLAETYARDPKFYQATFCVGCGTHLPVEEFVWDGTNEIVGS